MNSKGMPYKKEHLVLAMQVFDEMEQSGRLTIYSFQ